MDFLRMRREMVEHLAMRGIDNTKVLDAMQNIPRHEFMDSAFRHLAYVDQAWTIGSGQTITQPYMVAKMTSLAAQAVPNKVLEIGTGSGYQAAVLGKIFERVFSVERIQSLSRKAEQRIEVLGYRNIYCHHGDGMQGWSQWGPYNAIVCTAVSRHKPTVLLQQLNDQGILIIPLFTNHDTQHLYVFTKRFGKITHSMIEPVSFVPILAGLD